MSLSVLRGLDGLWSSRYSLIRFEKGKTAYTLRLHVSHGKLRSTSGCLDTKILSEKFSHYATTHHTTSCAEHNDCVHHTYFPSIPAYYVRSTTTVREVLLTPTVNVRFHGFIRSVKFNSWLPYSGKLQERKHLWIGENTILWRKFSSLIAKHMPSPQNFEGKLSWIATKLRNSQMFSPSKVSRYMVLQHGQAPGMFLQSLGTLPDIGRARYC